MWRILAIVGLTVKESVRRRVFLSLAFFAVLLVALAASLPAIDAESKLRLVQSWCLSTISFFGVLIAVFLAATSIPDDIEARKLYLVLTKPVTRLQTLAGKFLGFAAVLLLFVLGMGLLSVLYIRWVDGSLSGPGSGLLVARRQIEATSCTLLHPASKPGSADADLGVGRPPRLWLHGATESALVWNFTRLYEVPFGRRVAAELTAHARSVDALYAANGYLEIRRKDTQTIKRIDDLRLLWNAPARFDLPNELIDDTGRLEIVLRPADRRSEIGVEPASLVLYTEPEPLGFELNFAKSLAATYAQILMIVAMTTMGSAAVSGPVSIFLGLFFYFAGSVVRFVANSMPTVETTIRAMARRAEGGHIHASPDDLPVWLLQYSQGVSDLVIQVIPDLGRFDTPEAVLKGVVIPSSHVFDLYGYAGSFVLIAFLLGWMFLSLRELK